MKIILPDLTPLLPILGTLGLILIVLEGSLELEFNNSKIPLIKKSFVIALIPIMTLSFSLAWLFSWFGGSSFKDALLNAIPFSVISSSIAIPSVRDHSKGDKEFVVYESSFSDIIGILFFNFMAFNSTINLASFANFGLQLLVIIAVSFIATIGLSLLLSKIDHHIKFAPIVLLIILIYEISKTYNLPALLFILLFGLFLGNLDELKRLKWMHRLKPDELDLEVYKFKELITEATFLVRSLFFLLFGYLMQSAEILNTDTFKWALIITGVIFSIRAILLKLFRFSLIPLVYIAPRGLINILLLISILPEKMIGLVNKSLMIQVIFLTAFVMMIGSIITKRPLTEVTEELKTENNNI